MFIKLTEANTLNGTVVHTAGVAYMMFDNDSDGTIIGFLNGDTIIVEESLAYIMKKIEGEKS